MSATGVVAHPGYTTISTISYAVVLLFALAGIVILMNRWSIGQDRGFFFALIPFMFLGGTLRVVEDANAILFRETGEMLIGLPWIGVLISPIIYFSVFILALIALLVSLWLADRRVVERYEYPLAAAGTVALLATIGGLGWLAVTTEELGFFPIVPIVTLGGATVLTAVVWVLLERYAPSVNAGTGYMGALVIWGHTVDGIANVLSLDWAASLGLPSYAPKHVVNAWIVETTGSLQPAWLSELIGTAWPFLFVKIAVATLVVWVFEEEMMEESPQYSMLLLVAVLAVGLGPGTRDFLRATFGI